jgi:hypothetical protein
MIDGLCLTQQKHAHLGDILTNTSFDKYIP